MLSLKDIRRRSPFPKLVEVYPPESEPIGIQDYLNIPNIKIKDKQKDFKNKLVSARELIERYSGKALVTRTINQLIDYDPLDPPMEIVLRRSPVRKINAIYVKDDLGNETLVDSDIYTLSRTRLPFATLSLLKGNTWPGTISEIEGIRIECICGFGTPVKTLNIATGVFTALRHPYIEEDLIRLTTIYGDLNQPPVLPTGLELGANYYAKDVSGDTLKLSLTPGGAALTYTNAGSGRLFLGEIPASALRAVMITASSDLLEDEGDETADQGASGIPKLARQLIGKPLTI